MPDNTPPPKPDPKYIYIDPDTLSPEDFDPTPQFEFPDNSDFDYRPPDSWDPAGFGNGNPHILSLIDDYLEGANVKTHVREHIPLLAILAGTRIADHYNSVKQIHRYAPNTPFRYILHLTQLGGSGTDKGATVEAFYHIVGSNSDAEHPLFSTGEYKGGSLESLRGGTATVGSRRFVQFGGLERAYDGFVYVPEFTQLAALAERSSGAIQTIIAWADTAKMTFDTVSGGYVRYFSPASLILGLQTAKVTDVENVVIGWNRRSIYDQYTTPMTEDILPSNRKEPTEGDPHALETVRGAIRSVWKNWKPTHLDWGPFHEWLEHAYRNHVAVAQDEQMLYSLTLGYHIVAGGPVAGSISIGVSKHLDRILDRILWTKRLARITIEARTANDVLEVVRDPYLLGNGQTVDRRALIRILAARLSIGEDLVEKTLPMLEERQMLVSSLDAQDRPQYTLGKR